MQIISQEVDRLNQNKKKSFCNLYVHLILFIRIVNAINQLTNTYVVLCTSTDQISPLVFISDDELINDNASHEKSLSLVEDAQQRG
jgi:hypothetical protein